MRDEFTTCCDGGHNNQLTVAPSIIRLITPGVNRAPAGGISLKLRARLSRLPPPHLVRLFRLRLAPVLPSANHFILYFFAQGSVLLGDRDAEKVRLLLVSATFGGRARFRAKSWPPVCRNPFVFLWRARGLDLNCYSGNIGTT